VAQTLNTNVVQQVTIFKKAKGSRGVSHWFKQERPCKVTKNSASSNSAPAPIFAFFHHFALKISNAILHESCVPCKTAHFSYWVIF
jgi:hypothetical protein